MFFKICLWMKYVLQDHNQSLQVLHLEILANRTILQSLPKKKTTSATNQTMKTFGDAKQVTVCFLNSFHPSSDDIFLQTGHSRVVPHFYNLCALQQGNMLHQQVFSVFLYKIREINYTASPSTLLGTYNFHAPHMNSLPYNPMTCQCTFF